MIYHIPSLSWNHTLTGVAKEWSVMYVEAHNIACLMKLVLKSLYCFSINTTLFSLVPTTIEGLQTIKEFGFHA